MPKNKLVFIILLLFVGAGAFVIFPKDKASKTNLTQVDLYYYDPQKDIDENGNIKCSADGLVAVQRSVLSTGDIISETINLLISGDLRESEMEDGITTEFPLDGFFLTKHLIENGVLTLEFSDNQNKTTGGACRVGVLWAQIEKTAKQFAEVREVRFLPEYLFQP